jgi:hypothetical protein
VILVSAFLQAERLRRQLNVHELEQRISGWIGDRLFVAAWQVVTAVDVCDLFAASRQLDDGPVEILLEQAAQSQGRIRYVAT